MKKIIVICFLSLMACSPKVVSFSKSDVERAVIKFPSSTEASLIEGKNLYSQNCQSCHLLKSPTSRSEEGWRQIVPPMVKEANKKAGKVILTPESEQKILAYLVTVTTAPSK
jgi:cytochrome c5